MTNLNQVNHASLTQGRKLRAFKYTVGSSFGKFLERAGSAVAGLGQRLSRNQVGDDQTAAEESTSSTTYSSSQFDPSSRGQGTRVKQNSENLGEKKETSDAV